MSHAAAHWDRRYAQGPGSPEPAPFVTALTPYLGGVTTAVDLGGGSGRHARWLADRGIEVTLVDISAAALAFAVHEHITTLQHDLEAAGWPPSPRAWDLALLHYFYAPDLIVDAAAHLAPGGRLVVAQPTVRNLERHDRPSRRFLLEEGELADLIADLPLTPLLLTESWTDEGRHEARLIARHDR